MKILIHAFGSRGDTQPYLALAVGLQQAGHRVTLAASHTSAAWIQSYGVNAYPVRFDLQAALQKSGLPALMKSRNVIRQMRVMFDVFSVGVLESLDDFWQAAQDADFVVQTFGGLGGVEVASQRGLPIAFAYLMPIAPTHVFPAFGVPLRLSLGGGYNYLTHWLMQHITWRTFLGGPLNQWRGTRLGLPPWRSPEEMLNTRRTFGTPWLFAYSPSVLPKPLDWEAHHHVTGYWFLEAQSDWQPTAELAHFLESGPPPVYVGFGSMRDDDPERLTRLTLRALELAGQRGILAGGWGGVTQPTSSASMFYVDNAPHDWLFPRMAAVIHHGGAGTIGAGFRAGVPQIITPFVLDQYAWADLVVKVGVGPRTSEMKKLTAEKLAEAINTAVNDSALRARAAALGEKIRAENGIARAVELIERHEADFRQRY